MTPRTLVSRLLVVLLFCLLSHTGEAQTLQRSFDNEGNTILTVLNDSLRTFQPFEVSASVDLQAPQLFSILEQDVVFVPNAKVQGKRSAPLVEPIMQGKVRKKDVIGLKLAVSRPAQGGYYITKRLKVKVFSARKSLNPVPQMAEIQDHPLASGSWYKLRFNQEGLYRITYEELNEAGVDVSTVNPQRFQVWGMNGWQLDPRNNQDRPDFEQIPIIIEGEEDGSFDPGDAILVYVNSIHNVQRIKNLDSDYRFIRTLHPFATHNTRFLTIGSQNGLRITSQAFQTGGVSVTSTEGFRWIEQELYKTEDELSSGQEWLGQVFTTDSFNNNQIIFQDTMPDWDTSAPVSVSARFAARSTSSSRFFTSANGQDLGQTFISSIFEYISDSGASAYFGSLRTTISPISAPGRILTLNTRFETGNAAGQGWVDFIELEYRQQFIAENGQLVFWGPKSVQNQLARIELEGFESEPLVFNISNPQNPQRLSVQAQGGSFVIGTPSNPDMKFAAYTRFLKVGGITRIENQNISGVRTFPNYIIITAPELLESAQELASYRESRGLRTLVVTQEQAFNEFSGGVADLVGLREVVRHFYVAAGENAELLPKYLLLFGDTHFDYKNIQGEARMNNFVFTYQSPESISRTGSFGSDDYFGMLDTDEGAFTSQSELIDIGIGRLPVQTKEEADLMVNKIKHYENRLVRNGAWQTQFTFIADDDLPNELTNRDLHHLNADSTAGVIDMDRTGIRLQKIYSLNYPAENTSVGRRIPQASQEFIDAINNGTLVMNYSGHGAEQILSDERLFTTDMISSLTNWDKLTLFVTATCSFGRYDSNEDQSGAELLVLSDQGGAIASLTTSRVVYTGSSVSSNNFGLNIALTLAMTNKVGLFDQTRTLGDVYRETKNTGRVGPSGNSKRFLLLGDPALEYALPGLQATVQEINGEVVDPSANIQFRALDKIQIGGRVEDLEGTLQPDFNGEISIQVRDAQRFVPLPQDRVWVQNRNCYTPRCGHFVQNDILFNGKATVTNGRFSSTFIIPKDISFSGGIGRIVLYAESMDEQVHTASGAFSDFRIDGINENAVNDGQGPELRMYLNDETFVDGSMVNERPKLIVEVMDPSGVNTAATGVGHELLATLTKADGTNEQLILNEFYTSALDDFTKGSIEYDFQDLEKGNYRLNLRAWDVFNNPSEQEIAFSVETSDQLKVRQVYNYPNPMHQSTTFVVEHNQSGNLVDVFLRVYTLSGRPVYTYRSEEHLATNSFYTIPWNGRDQDGDLLSTGTYLYMVRIASETSQGKQVKEKIEKLVVIH